MEELGKLKTFVAFEDDQAVGYINFVVSPNLHYGKQISATESFFVKESHRNSGAGMMLLKEAEEFSKNAGSVAFLVSAPFEGKLCSVLKKSKSYKETNAVFFRSLA
jgi:GNAT superfamily N-acetyltransferase